LVAAWAALRSEAAQAIDELLDGLADDIYGLAEELGVEAARDPAKIKDNEQMNLSEFRFVI